VYSQVSVQSALDAKRAIATIPQKGGGVNVLWQESRRCEVDGLQRAHLEEKLGTHHYVDCGVGVRPSCRGQPLLAHSFIRRRHSVSLLSPPCHATPHLNTSTSAKQTHYKSSSYTELTQFRLYVRMFRNPISYDYVHASSKVKPLRGSPSAKVHCVSLLLFDVHTTAQHA
jgi:hypothetical protein